MATTLTRNLKLRVTDGMSADARYNLERLDALGATYLLTSTDDIHIRSLQDIVVDPRSLDLGATGGGILHLGDSTNPMSELQIRATEVYVNGELLPDPSDILTASGGGTEPYLGLPTANGQVLKGDTDGTRYWSTLAGLVASQNEAIDWLPADGSTKTIIHNYAAEYVEVQVYDPATTRYISVNNITYVDNNTLQIDIIGVPANTWKVFIREVLN